MLFRDVNEWTKYLIKLYFVDRNDTDNCFIKRISTVKKSFSIEFTTDNLLFKYINEFVA